MSGFFPGTGDLNLPPHSDVLPAKLPSQPLACPLTVVTALSITSWDSGVICYGSKTHLLLTEIKMREKLRGLQPGAGAQHSAGGRFWFWLTLVTEGTATVSGLVCGSGSVCSFSHRSESGHKQL